MSSDKNMTNHIDKLVIYLFIAAFLISAGTFAFRYSKYAPCDEVLFTVNAKDFRAGEMIKFKDNTTGAAEWKWEFGDSTVSSYQKDPLHVFKKEGEYKVRLIVNNICERVETVVIKEKLTLLDSTKFPVFTLPESIRVGQTLNVKDETDNASTWEWRFGESATIDADTERAEYVYEEAGLKTVSLVVNGDLTYITKKRINVTPIPGEKKNITEIDVPKREKGWNIKRAPKDAMIKDKPGDAGQHKPTVVPYINERDFEIKLNLISKEKTTPQAFSEYFCGDINKPVVVNGKNTTFLVFCEKIRDRGIKIKKLNLFRDKGSNCIKTIIVDYKKTGLF